MAIAYPAPPAKNDAASLSKQAAPATTVGKALAELTGFEKMENGIKVEKITTMGKFVPRYLTISKDRFALFITHEKITGGGSGGKSNGVLSTMANKITKAPLIRRAGHDYTRYLDVADLGGVQIGVVGTQRLEGARNKNRLKGLDSKVDERASEIVTIFHTGKKTLDMLVPNASDREALVTCLRAMRSTYHMAKSWVSNENLLLRYIWYDVDADKDGGIGRNEFATMLNRINWHIPKAANEYTSFLKEMRSGGEGSKNTLTFNEVRALLHRLKTKSGSAADIVWNKVFGEKKSSVSAKTFMEKFLHGVQGMTYLTIEDVKELVAIIKTMEFNILEEETKKGEITRGQFATYLFDSLNGTYDPAALNQDPYASKEKFSISRYWINTSHNTYLSGDQLRSDSSVAMYMNAMRRGCKCLELDCWDGEKSASGKPLPVIFHGHTMTSKILFEDVIRGVKAYLESNPNTFPIILSLENHCSHEYQESMAADMKDILGDLLWVPNLKDGDLLPSPSDLIGRVIIKGKRPPESEEAESTETENAVDEEMDGYEQGEAAAEGKIPAKKAKIVPALARLTLFHGTKYKNFEDSTKEPTSHMHSISETKISKILDKDPRNGPDWQRYNTNHMTRTYPKGLRVDSSNYNPSLAWAAGSQLVALNFQTSDTPLIMNDGRFRESRRCGYVLKPSTVMADDIIAEDSNATIGATGYSAGADVFHEGALGEAADLTQDELTRTKIAARASGKGDAKDFGIVQDYMANHIDPIKVKIRILGGSCLPKPFGEKIGEKIDPYVKVTLHDVKFATASQKMTYETSSFDTKVVQNNGFCPVWNEDVKELNVRSPSVAMLVFSLKEDDPVFDDSVAEVAIPCNRLRQGYRSVQLFDLNNTRTGPYAFASLLIEIKIE